MLLCDVVGSRLDHQVGAFIYQNKQQQLEWTQIGGFYRSDNVLNAAHSQSIARTAASSIRTLELQCVLRGNRIRVEMEPADVAVVWSVHYRRDGCKGVK